MFKSKAKKYTMNAFKKSLKESSNILSHRVTDGMKYAQDQIIYLTDYMRKSPNISLLRNKIIKNPGNGAIALAGLGLIAFGLYRMMMSKK